MYTCSMLPEENEDVVREFLGARPEYRLVPAVQIVEQLGWQVDAGEFLRLAPHREGCDAFFAAVLEREAPHPVASTNAV